MIGEGKQNEKGSTLIEFTMVGIPLMLIVSCILQMSLTMWNYHTLAYAVREGARYVATKGEGCTYSGNSCSIEVGAVAQQIAASGPGLLPGDLDVSLTATNGANTTTITCNPLDSCYSNTTIWPPSSANAPGSLLSVTGQYPSETALIFFFMPGKTPMRLGSFTLLASSQQIVEF